MNIRSYLYQASAIASVWTLSAQNALAQIFGPTPDIGGRSDEDFYTLIFDVLQFVLNFVALLAVVFIVIAGIRLIVSGGEEGEKDKAKRQIIYVVIGLILILIAQAIVALVKDVILT